jgi:2-polyprenyl-6-methoxyphenol hydroxylase-like FAD-dependent oxidoreductase
MPTASSLRRADGSVLRAAAALNATGRRPNTANLGLEALGVALAADGSVVVDADSRSTAAGIWAIGDVTNRDQPHARWRSPRAAPSPTTSSPASACGSTTAHVASAVFADPPLASIGLTEEQAGALGPVAIFESEFRPMKTAFAGGTARTYMKLVVDGLNDRVLGVHMLGTDAAGDRPEPGGRPHLRRDQARLRPDDRGAPDRRRRIRADARAGAPHGPRHRPMTRPPGDADVAIVGGGPCGLMLANELGRRGVRCLLVDPKNGTTLTPQANATQARTMEHYRRLGFASEIRAQGLPPDHPTDIAYFTRYTGHELARLPLPTAAQAVKNIQHMTGSWSAAELPHRISQKYVEATLRKHAESLPSADVRYGWALEGSEDCGNHVLAQVRQNGAAHPVSVKADYLVGVDGPRSLVRNRLGIAWSGASGIKREFMGGKMFAVHFRAPAFYEVLKSPPAWMYVSVNSQRRAFMASVDGKSEFAFHAAVHDGEDADSWTFDDAQRIFSEALGMQIPMEVISVCTWTAGHSLVAEHLQRGRVFIGGDAAHLFTPTGGLGYNTAIEDAVNLGWKLASVIKGAAPEALLDSYELERKPLAERNTAYARGFADSVGMFNALPLLEQDDAAGEAERQRASDYLNAHVRRRVQHSGHHLRRTL